MDQNTLSKRQQKKQKKKELQIQKKIEKKVKKKEKKKEKQDEKQIQIVENQQEGKQTHEKKEKYIERMNKGMKIVVDLQFSKLMTEKEKVSLVSQIQLCHSINQKSENALNLIVSSMNEDIMELIKKNNGQNWGIKLIDEHYLTQFKKEELIYLSGDCDKDIEEFDDGYIEKVYIIGGLVDHNRLKNITYDKAKEQGIEMRRFPISKYIKLKTSTILTVNQCFEIILKLKNGCDWQQALDQAIPKRKLQ